MGSESDSLFGQLKSILDISDSAAGLTVEKIGGGYEGGGGECEVSVVELFARERVSIFYQ